MRRTARILLASLALTVPVAGLAACGGGDDGEAATTAAGQAATAAPVAEVKAAVEQASGLTLTEAPVPAGAAGVAAVLTSGPDEVAGQRLVIAIAPQGGTVDLTEETKAALGPLAGIDVDATGVSGFGSRVIKGAGDPVALVYLVVAPSREDLAAVDRGDAIKQALAGFGYTDS
ncbi:MAG: hypothetical protein MUE51_00230 [Thermoleophilia bacterium]|nr:hypothetical protein [Thermoleophilia bacterium]